MQINRIFFLDVNPSVRVRFAIHVASYLEFCNESVNDEYSWKRAQNAVLEEVSSYMYLMNGHLKLPCAVYTCEWAALVVVYCLESSNH
mgnify:CR=1 FL=1